MRIHVLTFWHNEAALAPFFLNHYAYADKIIVVLGEDTADNTREICARFPNVEIQEYTFPGGLLDDDVKIERFNALAAAQSCDWLLALDSDEFIFPPTRETPGEFLGRQPGNLLDAAMWQVYRHATEGDLDPDRPVVGQRRHGNPVPHHVKPIIVKPEAGTVWMPGNHHVLPNPGIRKSAERFIGAHWAYADAEIAIARYVKGRRDRFSAANIQKRHGWHLFEITEDKIREECRQHLNDPLLFGGQE
jgi:hypothetical protein